MTDPIPCGQCSGRGGHWQRILNLGTREMEDHYVSCIAPGCDRGVFNREMWRASLLPTS